MGCFWCGVGQFGSLHPAQRAASDATVYESFFQQVVQLINVSGSGSGLLNGQPTDLKRPTVRNAIGLTEAESKALNAAASDCEIAIRQFDLASEPSIFDARLRIIAAENAAASTSAILQLNALAEKHREIVLAHIERLRAALGNSRFAMLDSWIHARQQADSFFPLVSSK
jgi:hypothetical protein